uniref:J domain-containing protein n=1 Tax=Caenorhabditis japonica TaxID=281687 RepID=A0A8R1I6T2_CAEJA
MRLSWLWAVAAVMFVLSVLADREDPYKVLGIRRKSTIKEIKSAYKILAKKWHPDRNADGGSSTRFMEIAEAYEVLSDPLKKERYDRFGTFDDVIERDMYAERARTYYGGNFRGFDLFDESVFEYKYRMSHHQYEFKVLEMSHTKPFIVYVYHNSCKTCYTSHPIWKRAIDALEPLGYGIGTVHAYREGNLMEKLRLDRVPSLVAIIEGRVIPMRIDSGFSD